MGKKCLVEDNELHNFKYIHFFQFCLDDILNSIQIIAKSYYRLIFEVFILAIEIRNEFRKKLKLFFGGLIFHLMEMNRLFLIGLLDIFPFTLNIHLLQVKKMGHFQSYFIDHVDDREQMFLPDIHFLQYSLYKFIIMDNDPSLDEDYVELYQNQNQYQICSKDMLYRDSIMLRLFRNPYKYKIQLTSQTNMNFFYKAILAPNSFQIFVKENKIDLEFNHFPDWLKKNFKEQLSFKFELLGSSFAQLFILKEEKYKTYEVATIKFDIGSENEIKESIMFRYERMKVRLQMLNQYWNGMKTIMKTKNPTLFSSVVKGTKKSNVSFK